MISIIIPKRKDENINDLLEAIRQNFWTSEIIAVDEGLERSAQRNIGIDRAKGDMLLILDSDQFPSSDLLRECSSMLRFGYDALYIPEIIMTKGWFGKLRNWERQFYTGTKVDVVRAVKTPCPKFNESMSGPEDSDWDRRVKGRRGTTYACLYHYDNVSLIQYFKKKAYYAKSMREFTKQNPQDEVLNFKYRCWTVFTENGKWKRLIKKPHYTLALMITIFIRGLIYWRYK